MTKEFIDNGEGHISGVRSVNVDWTKDESGRWEMKERAGSEKIYPADLVLLAMGFLGPERAIANQLELDLDARSNFQTKNYRTNISNVFAAGGTYEYSFWFFLVLACFRLSKRSVFGGLGYL